MRNKSILAALTLAALTSCAPRPAPQPAPPAPQSRTAEPPRPLPEPPPAAWEDAPLAGGDWTYRDEGGSSVALFAANGAPLFQLRCSAGREILLSLAGEGQAPMIVRTSYGARSLAAEARQGMLVARLAVSDVLLDQMVFSRGRFAVEAAGSRRLVLPAWSEPARVVEDCRS